MEPGNTHITIALKEHITVLNDTWSMRRATPLSMGIYKAHRAAGYLAKNGLLL